MHTTTYGYDADNRLTSVTDAANDTTTYGYDAVGDLTTRTDGNLHVTTYGYDLADRLTTTTDPLNHVWTTTLDPAGNAVSRLDPNGKTTTYTYDALDRLSSVTYAASTTPFVRFTYDPNGNRTAMYEGSNSVPAETFTYDALDRLSTDTRGTDTFSYTYDPAGNITGRSYPVSGSGASYTYDDDGRMSTQGLQSYTYDPAGNLATEVTDDGVTARLSYDRAGRLVEVANTTATGTLSRFTYVLDAAGNRTGLSTTLGNAAFGYDPANRLTGVCYAASCPNGLHATTIACLACIGNPLSRPAATVVPNPSDTFATFAYDPVGNRRSMATYLGSTAYAYNAADELTSVTPPGSGATTYTYDANGNETAAGVSTYAYDLANHLASATEAGTTQTYTYSGDGIRLSAATGTQANKILNYSWDRANGLPELALERDGHNTLLRTYYYGLGLQLQQASGTTYDYHHDGLGSVSDVAGSGATSLYWAEYQAYGQVRAAGTARRGAPTNFFGFTGQYQDGPTGLYHLGARQYDPATGRFLTTDPASPGPSNPYVSAYAYAKGNPIRYTDPSGRWTVGVCLTLNVSLFNIVGIDISPICVVAASSGEVGLTSSGGGGVAAGAKLSGGLVAQVSSGDYVEDLSGSFGNTGGSGSFGGGVSGSVFGGSGHCGQDVVGGTFGPSFGAGVEGHATQTDTTVLGTFGASRAPCSSTPMRPATFRDNWMTESIPTGATPPQVTTSTK